MVNNVNVSQYDKSVPPEMGKTNNRSIQGGPLYLNEHIKAILKKGSSSVRTWTKKCQSDLKNKLNMDLDDLVELIGQAVDSGRFIGSEWCQQAENGPWAACDAYQIFCMEEIKAAHKEMQIEYYIKFAIAKTGNLIFTVSCHTPES